MVADVPGDQRRFPRCWIYRLAVEVRAELDLMTALSETLLNRRIGLPLWQF